MQVMTGVAWGEYQDYLYGRFDGKDHQDEAQTDKDGKQIAATAATSTTCRRARTTASISAVGVKRALDAGAEAIYLEEPEFWVRGGWERELQARVEGVLPRGLAAAATPRPTRSTGRRS